MPPVPHRSTDTSRSALTRRRHLLILVAAVLAIYLSALPGGYVWTDRPYLLEGQQRLLHWNELGDLLRHTAAQFRTRLDGPPTSPGAGPWEVTATLDYSLGWSLWGDCATCFRLEGILWHALTVVGLYALGRHLLALKRHGIRIAFWAALGFAAHSIAVALVPTSYGRPTLLAAALAVWSLVLFTRLPATSKSQRRHTYRWLLGMLILAAAAVGAAEVALVTPLAALLIAWFESRERGRPGLLGIGRSRRLALVLLFTLAALLVGYRVVVFGGIGLAGDYPGSGPAGHLGSALRLFWTHVDRVLLPGEPVLADALAVTRGWGAGEVAALLGVLVWLGLTGFGLWWRHPAALGSAWFLLWSLPGTGLLPVERYYTEAALYLASWGLVFGLAFALMQLWRPVGRQLARGSEVVLFGPLILTLAFVSSFSNARFWNDAALFESEVDHDPRYVEGRAMLARLALAEDRPADAMNHALNAIEAAKDKKYINFYPRYDIYRQLGRAQQELALYAEAEGSFGIAIEERPNSAAAHYGRARARLAQDNLEGATADLQRALALRPGYAAAEADLGIILIGQGRHAEGLELLEAGLRAGLDDQRRRAAMADAYIAAENWPAAQHALAAALEHRETAVERAKLAWVTWQQGQVARAREHINMALQLEEESSAYVLWVARQLEEPAP
jgi:tetratricopeptide (TPR) repeat protein